MSSCKDCNNNSRANCRRCLTSHYIEYSTVRLTKDDYEDICVNRDETSNLCKICPLSPETKEWFLGLRGACFFPRRKKCSKKDKE